MSKHGSLFWMSILGSKTIVLTDQEVNIEIFKQDNNDIKPESKSKLIENLRDFSLYLVRSPSDSSFWKALYIDLLACKNAMKMIKGMFKERRERETPDELIYGPHGVMEIMIDKVEKEGEYL
ncbi:unnamed protein product [Arabis nemorensis]|uniref:Uncharacterized protein n=1 Tax=Arabis nemorensis TaxID=586526 RepID=A0A565AU10_9BRAS|nr:unnamed protein product [Arabis nemorensis]